MQFAPFLVGYSATYRPKSIEQPQKLNESMELSDGEEVRIDGQTFMKF